MSETGQLRPKPKIADTMHREFQVTDWDEDMVADWLQTILRATKTSERNIETAVRNFSENGINGATLITLDEFELQQEMNRQLTLLFDP